MCTAISFGTHRHFFGRNLDLEGSFGEKVVVTPRGYAFPYRMEAPAKGSALIGMAIVQQNVPLYYDAVNEFGLGMAGLNFPGSAAYLPPAEGKRNVTPFEIIPYVLGRCKTVKEARELLGGVNLVNIPFSAQFPLTPLHFMISDRTESLVVEPMADGLRLHDDPVHVLTNNPPFEMQMMRLNDYLNLSPNEPDNRFSKALPLTRYSRGMGAMGLPGDWSSASRFVRAAFVRANLRAGKTPEEERNGFFHILGSVTVPDGCMCLREGVFEKTIYTSCCDTDEMVYYVTTYENRTPAAYPLRGYDLDGEALQ